MFLAILISFLVYYFLNSRGFFLRDSGIRWILVAVLATVIERILKLILATLLLQTDRLNNSEETAVVLYAFTGILNTFVLTLITGACTILILEKSRRRKIENKLLRDAGVDAQALNEARYKIGLLYLDGVNVRKDLNLAFKWFSLAADLGHQNAQNNLALMFANGEGVKKDLAKAYMWFTVSASSGSEEAKRNIERIKNKLSEAQLLEAQNLASARVTSNSGREPSTASREST